MRTEVDEHEITNSLSAQVIERVKTFDFGAKDGISAITIAYPIDFLAGDVE